MNEKNLNAVQIRNDIVNLEKPFYSRIEIITAERGMNGMLGVWGALKDVKNRATTTATEEEEKKMTKALQSKRSIRFDLIQAKHLIIPTRM